MLGSPLLANPTMLQQKKPKLLKLKHFSAPVQISLPWYSTQYRPAPVHDSLHSQEENPEAVLRLSLKVMALEEAKEADQPRKSPKGRRVSESGYMSWLSSAEAFEEPAGEAVFECNTRM